MNFFRPFRTRLGAAVALCSLAACARTDTPATDTMAKASAPASADTSKPGMSGMTNMSGNPDQDFLRMMSDHHKGLIGMVHLTVEGKPAGGVTAVARQLDTKQDAELDTMTTMLEKDFKDPYTPKVMPEHQAMIDALKAKSGKDYDRTFLQSVIAHHEEALKMVDMYLPTSKSPAVKMMAEKMKADQTKEIADFKRRLGALGG